MLTGNKTGKLAAGGAEGGFPGLEARVYHRGCGIQKTLAGQHEGEPASRKTNTAHGPRNTGMDGQGWQIRILRTTAQRLNGSETCYREGDTGAARTLLLPAEHLRSPPPMGENRTHTSPRAYIQRTQNGTSLPDNIQVRQRHRHATRPERRLPNNSTIVGGFLFPRVIYLEKGTFSC